MEFELLLHKCKLKDKKSQNILYERFHDYVYYTCIRFQKDDAISKDITQDIFIKIFNKIDLFDGKDEKQFSAWIIRMTKNFIIDQLRRKKSDNIIFIPIDTVNVIDDIVSDIRLYSDDLINASIKKLPEQQKNAINLYYFENLTHEQIADRLNIGVGSSKSNLFKAKNNMKKLLTT